MDAPPGPARPLTQPVLGLLAVAVAVSIVHYADNTINYEDFPADGALPDPSRLLVGASWFLFTGFLVAAIVRLRAGDLRNGALLLAAYSGSGLVGFLHYSVPGAFDMPWWRHAHVIADIACGLAILAVALSLVRRRPAAA